MPDLLSKTCTCDTAPLRLAVSLLAPICPKRSPKPVLMNLKLDVDPEKGTALTATDLEVLVTLRVVGVRSDHAFSVLLSPNRLQQILARTRGDAVMLELKDEDEQGNGKLVVWSEGYKFELNTEGVDTYPAFSEAPSGGHHDVEAKDLRRLIRTTSYAVDEGGSDRYALGGCAAEPVEPGVKDGATRLYMVATDGRCLARASAPCAAKEGGMFADGPGTPVFPLKFLKLLERLTEDDDGPVSLYLNKNNVRAETDRAVIYSRLVEGRFPRYQEVFPSNPAHKAQVNSGTLADRVTLASVTTSEESKGVDFKLATGLLSMTANSSDVGSGEVTMPLSYDGPDLEFCLLPKYVTQAMHSLGPDATLDMNVIEPKMPVVFRDSEFEYVVMPMTRD